MRDIGFEFHPAFYFLVEAIGEVATETGKAELLFMLKGPSSMQIRPAAIGLGRLQAEEAVPGIAKALDGVTDRATRNELVKALISIGTPEAAKILEQVLPSVKAAKLRKACEKVIAQSA